MMFHPFAELTNRTPSPSQQDENGRTAARKHSPWTAARQKKKTRSFHSSFLEEAIASQESVDSADARTDTEVCCSDIEAEFSLADGLSPSTSDTDTSPHSSPPVNRGEDADVHPVKAYIVDQEATSPDLLSKFRDASNATAVRSPVWFGSAAVQDELAEAADRCSRQSQLQHSSSAPSNILFHRFDAVDHQQQQGRQHAGCSHITPTQMHLNEGQLQHATVEFVVGQSAGSAAVPGRRRGLATRRRSWTGAEAHGPSAVSAANIAGISRLAAHSSCAASSRGDLIAGIAGASAGAAVTAADVTNVADGFELRSRLGATGRESLSDDLQRLPWDDLDKHEHQLQYDSDIGSRHLCAMQQCHNPTVSSVAWYEEQLQEAADHSDMTAAQQLWACMQSSGVAPSRKIVNYYLTCCYYGGCDPVEAEEAVRQMCLAADIEPDALTARLLASIDISWQQLHCV